MWGKRNCLSFETAIAGIEPSSIVDWQSGALPLDHRSSRSVSHDRHSSHDSLLRHLRRSRGQVYFEVVFFIVKNENPNIFRVKCETPFPLWYRTPYTRHYSCQPPNVTNSSLLQELSLCPRNASHNGSTTWQRNSRHNWCASVTFI